MDEYERATSTEHRTNERKLDIEKKYYAVRFCESDHICRMSVIIQYTRKKIWSVSIEHIIYKLYQISRVSVCAREFEMASHIVPYIAK